MFLGRSHHFRARARAHARARFFLFFYCALSSFYSYALTSDNNAPLHIIADQSNYNYKNGMNEFSGHVIVDQGHTHLRADRVTTKNNAQHKIQEIIAYGFEQPAHYWTLTKIGDPEAHAYAKIIKYYPIESNVTLEKSATIAQGENRFQGELIHYNSNDQVITVPQLEKSRAVIVYNPNQS